MNITNDERRVIILWRLERLRTKLGGLMEGFDRDRDRANENHYGACETLRVELAEIGDGLGKACD